MPNPLPIEVVGVEESRETVPVGATVRDGERVYTDLALGRTLHRVFVRGPASGRLYAVEVPIELSLEVHSGLAT